MNPITAPVQKSARQVHRNNARSASVAHQSVAIIGLGYVGLPLALATEQGGYRVIGFDIDEAKNAALERRRAPFLSEEEQRTFRTSAMAITNDPRQLAEAEIVIICVPTPVNDDHTPDLRPLEAASTTVGSALRHGALVIVESTVSPGACESVALRAIEAASGLTGGKDFSFAHCPERINPGDTAFSVLNIPRVVGGLDDESLARATDFYLGIVDAEIIPMASLKEAEAVKMVENSFRDINIAFVNELAMSFEKAGIDIVNVIRGASSKPFAFMPHFPGCGVGGHCIPVDPYYLIHYGKENGFQHRFLETARAINNNMPAHTVDRLESALSEHGIALAGSTVALLGLTYKRDISDMRESPAEVIRLELEERGATVQSFDPYVARESTASSVDQALRGAVGVIIATDHREFKALTPEHFIRAGVGVVIDGRNCLSKELFANSGVTYRGIGR